MSCLRFVAGSWLVLAAMPGCETSTVERKHVGRPETDGSGSDTAADTDTPPDSGEDSGEDPGDDPGQDSGTCPPGETGDPPEEIICETPSFTPGQRFALDEAILGDIEFPDQRGPGVVLADLDGDEDLDLFWAVPSGPSRAFLNDGTGNLTEATMSLEDGSEVPDGIAAAAVDLDADGDQDLALARQTGRVNHLLYNEGGLVFRSVELPNSEGESKTTSFADVDNDGDLDLFTCGFSSGVEVHPAMAAGDTGFGPFDGLPGEGTFLYTQDAGVWTQEDDALPRAVFPSQCYQGTWLDVEGDGDLDIYLSNEAGPSFVPNQLLINDGTGHFEMDSECFCDLAIDGMGGAVGDANGDALPDLYLTDAGSNHLLVNHPDGGFVISTYSLTAIPDREEIGSSWGTQFVDLNQDGYEDLVTSYGWRALDTHDGGEGDVVLLADGTGSFVDATETMGLESGGTGRNAVIGDLNRDGRPDLVTGGVRETEGEAYYWQVWFGQGGCPPGVTLGISGAAAFGARVQVVLPDERVYYRWVEASTTYGSSARELYLGLGTFDRAQSITVHWADGTITEVDSLMAGTTASVSYP